MHAFYENRKLKTTTILKIICFCHLLKLFLKPRRQSRSRSDCSFGQTAPVGAVLSGLTLFTSILMLIINIVILLAFYGFNDNISHEIRVPTISKGSDQYEQLHSLIRAFASRLNIQ